MHFHAGSESAYLAIQTYLRYISNREEYQHHFHYNRLQDCPVEIIVLNPYESILTNDYRHIQVVSEFCHIWRIWKGLPNGSRDGRNVYQKLLEICEPLNLDLLANSADNNGPTSTSPLWRVHKPKQSNIYILILSGNELYGLPRYYIQMLSCLCQIEARRFPLHASSVIHRNRSYLFTGPSDAGKSTVASLSQELGAELLDEDQILLRHESDGRFYGDGWGYQVKEGHAPIQAIFSLVQAPEDRLIRMPQVKAAHLLLERFHDVVRLQLSPELHAQVFSQIAALARSVPMYELHFRKSPDFWKLIEAEFPD
jgi:hypothetical protein